MMMMRRRRRRTMTHIFNQLMYVVLCVVDLTMLLYSFSDLFCSCHTYLLQIWCFSMDIYRVILSYLSCHHPSCKLPLITSGNPFWPSIRWNIVIWGSNLIDLFPMDFLQTKGYPLRENINTLKGFPFTLKEIPGVRGPYILSSAFLQFTLQQLIYETQEHM